MRAFSALLPMLLLMVVTQGCRGEVEEAAARITGGDPHRGAELIRQYGCGSCHLIPGVGGAEGMVGPPLEHLASRTHLAGRLENDVPNLMRWIRHPQQVEPGNLMPEMGVTEAHARDIAAYLYTLR